jgi:threonine/homoserine/homoserine lactone efflux protein
MHSVGPWYQHRCTCNMTFLAFLVAAVVLAITPGPGIAYVVARTVAGGRSEGLASCFGTGIGGMLHVLAAALGLSLIVAQSAMAFNIVKYLGAAYLIYLGIRLLLDKGRQFAVQRIAAQGARRALFEGIMVEALNVKTALFFLAFLPQFVSPGEPLVPQLVLLGSICVALNTLVDVVAVFAADRLLRSEAARSARARLLTRVSGLTMLGLGAYLALARREA